MIPFLDDKGRQKANADGTLRWIRTKADERLAQCDHIVMNVAGKAYPNWKYIEMYCPITGKSGKKYPFRLNDAQIKTYQLWDSQMADMGYVRCNEGKGRQMGSSTLICALYWTMLFSNPGYRVAILADTEEKGKGLLRKYKFFYKNSPKPIREELEKHCITDSSTMLEFDFGDGIISGIQVIVANENAGASYTFQAIHSSEVALWKDIDATLMALEQTVGDEKGTFIIRETTARGPNEWKKHYEAGKNNNSEFRSVFLAWYLIESYRKPYDGHELIEYERLLKNEVGLDLDQIQWWKEKYNKSGQDLAYMKQEYPSTEAEMWQSKSVNIFNSDILAKRKEERNGKYIRRGVFEHDQPVYTEEGVGSPIQLGNPHLVLDEIGPITIFEEPIDGHPYAVCCDPAEQGDDYNAVHVIDCSNDRQVATYHKRKVDADTVAYQSYCLWLYYKTGGFANTMDNRVWATGERNRSTYWHHMLQRLGVDTVVSDKQENEAGRYIDQLGWRTSQTNRLNMIDSFKVAFRESEGQIVLDYVTLCEMESFQWKDGKPQAIGGEHDDLVMAYCGYFNCKNRGDFECDIRPSVAVIKKKHQFNPFARAESNTNQHFVNW